MKNFIATLYFAIFLPWSGATNSILIQNTLNMMDKREQHKTFYRRIIEDIHKERKLESILLVCQDKPDEPIMEGIQELQIPKVVLTKGQTAFLYKNKFNNNILTVLLISNLLDYDLLNVAMETMDYMRQSRVLVIAVDVMMVRDEYELKLLKYLQYYNLTNVLLSYLYTNKYMPNQHLMLKPYPDYHWQINSMANNDGIYFPQHWLNMQGKTLLTDTSYVFPGILVYEDRQGQFKIGGYVANLIINFAKQFNATLEYYEPLIPYMINQFSKAENLIERNQLDIQMDVTGSFASNNWLNFSNAIYFDSMGFLLECGRPFNTQEIFGVLVDAYFFGSAIIFTFILSACHSFIDYLFERIFQPSELVFSPRIFAGILSQSFKAKKSMWRCLKFIYILVSFVGLNFCTQFSARMSSLLTSPPIHAPLRTLEDFRKINIKIWIHPELYEEVINFAPFAEEFITVDKPGRGYYIQSITKSQYLTHNNERRVFTNERPLYCMPDEFIYRSLNPLFLQLQKNSPYVEPMNYFIGHIHANGLIDVWIGIVLDELNRGAHYPRSEEVNVLAFDDFFWIWIVLTIGLSVSSMVFLLEHLYKALKNVCTKDLHKY